MKEMLNELIIAEVDKALVSKIPGRKNWLIATEVIDGEMSIRYAGPAGRGEWCTTCTLKEMTKYHYRWYYFTYKKDYDEALKLIKG